MGSPPAPAPAAPPAARAGFQPLLAVFLSLAGLVLVSVIVAQLMDDAQAEGAGPAHAAAAAAEGAAVPAAAVAAPPAALSVTATDGEDVQVWLERENEAPRSIAPEAADLPPGRVALQIVRRTAEGTVRADVVRLTLQSGRRHLVAVGDAPLRARTLVEGRELDLAARFLPPGAVGVDDHAWRLVVTDPAPGEAPPAAGPALSLTFGPPRRELEDLWLSAKDQVLLVVNPYAEAVECRVEGGGWQHEIVLAGPVCRFIPIGGARTLKVVTRLLPGRELIEERTLTMAEGLPLHTVGGATIYRWLGAQEGPCPPAPDGALAFFSPETRVRLPVAGDPAHWLLVSQLGGLTSGLSAFVSDPPVLRGEAGTLTAQSGVQILELQAPAALAGSIVTGVATDGSALIAIANGVACDYSSGQPLYEPAPVEIARAVAGPSGLVLLTRTGRLATVRERQLVLGEALYDPSWRLAPAAGPEPAVWLHSGANEANLDLRLLDGTSSLLYLNWVGLSAVCPVGPRALLCASGNRIDRADLSGETISSDPVLVLPEGGPPILSIADLDGRLIFATRDAVFALAGNLVLPLVEGIGGEILPWRGGLLVHDARTLRLYQLTGPALAPLAPAEAVK